MSDLQATKEEERRAALVAILLDSLKRLDERGEGEAACRLAARACAALRQGAHEADIDTATLRQWKRFNALLHRLSPRTAPVGEQATP